MRNWPSALLSFLLSASQAVRSLEDEHAQIWRRELDALSALETQGPRGVQKMSEDRGEKFWHQYWQFDELASNLTILQSPLAAHDFSNSLFGRALFGRDASCPSTPVNTSSCASIGYPDSCCPVGDTCITVTDTGNGPVGCCAPGATCGSTIASCDTSSGYTSCPNSSNKGCCIPGYTCAGSICVNAGTQTVVATPSTTSSTSTTTLAVSVTTVTLTSASGFTTTATVFITLQTSSSSDSAAAPVRPTTDSGSTTTAVAPATVTTTTSTITSSSSTGTLAGAYCPTGYYQCSAVYLGGCCQVGRDCNTTTCPPSASTTLISGSATVVVAQGTQSGCANGWYSCPSSLGGNCCPTGYSCGQTDCPALISGAAAQAKEAPSGAGGLVIAWTLSVLGITAAIAMVML